MGKHRCHTGPYSTPDVRGFDAAFPDFTPIEGELAGKARQEAVISLLESGKNFYYYCRAENCPFKISIQDSSLHRKLLLHWEGCPDLYHRAKAFEKGFLPPAAWKSPVDPPRRDPPFLARMSKGRKSLLFEAYANRMVKHLTATCGVVGYKCTCAMCFSFESFVEDLAAQQISHPASFGLFDEDDEERALLSATPDAKPPPSQT